MPRTECPVCGEQTASESALREHAWADHSACHYCGAQRDDQHHLHRHWLLAHADDLRAADRKRAEADVETLSFRDRVDEQGVSTALTTSPVGRRALLLGGGGLVLGGGTLAAIEFLGGEDPTAAAESPVPPSPEEYTYARAATADIGSEQTITYYGNWKCGYCADFSTGFLGDLVEEYVTPGDIAIRFRHIARLNGDPFLGPDAVAAGHAGLAVWERVPEKYWAYHDHVLQNQPSERREWATADRLASFAEAVGIDQTDAIRSAVRENRYADALSQTSTDASDLGVTGTPTLDIDGTTVNPLEDRERTRSLIEDVIA
jgi:protein-disulfide isomerase